MMEALVAVKNLSIGIHRGKNLYSSVEDISFNIYPGEILGIAGESGSGKSLTALSIPGLLGDNKEITGGSIIYNSGSSPNKASKNLHSLAEEEFHHIRGKEISIVFQEALSSLNPLMKVKDQIAENLLLHNSDKPGRIKRKEYREKVYFHVKELLEELKFDEPEKIMETYPHRLSGGMCQRIMIALAVINKPRLLIADEPTTALDRITQEEIINLLKKINQYFGTSILFISHDLELVRKLCSRILIMYSGRILEEGNTGEVFFNPAHEYTKGLLGSIPRKENRGNDLKGIPGRIPSLEEGRPLGCPFHPRCKKSVPACMERFPVPKEVSETHTSRCILEE